MSILDDLTRKFPPEILKFNQQKHVYIPIEHFIGRLNEILGIGWGSTTRTHTFMLGPNKTSTGKVQWVASAAVDVWIRDEEGFISTRTGIGGDENFDPNTCSKTTLAEAFKKACNQFGIGGYLLGPVNPERDIHVQHHEALKYQDLNAIKKALTMAAELDDVAVNPDSLSEAYHVTKPMLQTFDGVDRALRDRF